MFLDLTFSSWLHSPLSRRYGVSSSLLHSLSLMILAHLSTSVFVFYCGIPPIRPWNRGSSTSALFERYKGHHWGSREGNEKLEGSHSCVVKPVFTTGNTSLILQGTLAHPSEYTYSWVCELGFYIAIPNIHWLRVTPRVWVPWHLWPSVPVGRRPAL